MSYALRTAVSGLWRERWINLLCVFTIAGGLLIISLSSLVVYNTHIAIKNMPDRFSVMVFLKDSIRERPDALLRKLESIDGVKKVRFISSQEALESLRSSLSEPDMVLEGFDGGEGGTNPLPASVELKLEKGAVSDEAVREIAGKAGAFDEVEDVNYAANILRVIQSVRFYTEGVGAAVVAVLVIAVLFVSYSTVKLLLYRKQDEIDTLKYLGATRGFIRAPFVLEGAIMGTGAGLVALSGLGLAYTATVLRLGAYLPILKTLEFPLVLLPSLPLAGLFVGVTGALMAVGRIRF